MSDIPFKSPGPLGAFGSFAVVFWSVLELNELNSVEAGFPSSWDIPSC